MNEEFSTHIIPECFIDTNLVETLVPTKKGYNHQTGCSKVVGLMQNMKQLKELGNVGLDCRYLNFAPQCEGWMQVTQNGGYGSFVINWSGVWKLTTAAAIPYYTGQYANSKRGFGFVTIGASVDDFHAAANETKKNAA